MAMAAVLDLSSSKNSATPRFETPRTPSRKTVGHQVIKVAEKLGIPMMPWQQHWSLVAGEMIQEPDLGIWVPAYPEAFYTVMRQQGKTYWLLAKMMHRGLVWESWDKRPQSIAYTAQSASDGYKKFRKEHVPILRQSELWPLIAAVRHTAGDRGLDFVNGSVHTILASTEEAGHGLTVDLGVLDEIFADEDDRREQAIVPATATRHDYQKLLTSTAGTEKSYLYLRKQEAGRAAVLAGETEGMAYLEFSADPDDPAFDPEDPKLWRQVMPALGYTVTERTVQNALKQMKQKSEAEGGGLDEFCRAWLNITKRRSSSRTIPDQIWRDVLADVSPEGTLVLGVDAKPGQDAASVAAVDSNFRAELIKHDSGDSWLKPYLVTLAKDLRAPVAIDPSGPVGYLVPQLESEYVEVIKISGRDLASACADIYSRIGDTRIQVRPTRCEHCGLVTLSEAAAGVTKQPSGDGWRWARKDASVDISPLMALTLASGAVSGIGGWKAKSMPMFGWSGD